MKGKEYIRTGAIQKVEVCLDHDEKRKLIKMKGKNDFFESTGAIQTSGVGLDHKYQTRLLSKMKVNKNVGKSTGGV